MRQKIGQNERHIKKRKKKKELKKIERKREKRGVCDNMREGEELVRGRGWPHH